MRLAVALFLVGCASAQTAPPPAPPEKPASARPAPAPAPAPAAVAETKPAVAPHLDRPCAAGSAELADGLARLAALDARIGALQPDDNHRPANEELIALLEHPCLALVDIDPDDLVAEAAPALVELWSHGGKDWLESQLSLATRREITFPPALRRVAAAETRPGHPGFALLCSLADPGCGQRTAGWWSRAEAYFESHAKEVRRGRDHPTATEEICAAEARELPVAERYAHWERCASAISRTRYAMPLGRFKEPTSGWLIVRGRRGHYSFCDEVRMYSLATGAAYVSQSCNQLFIADADKVRSGTAADRKPKITRGTMSVDNLRETAWMLLQLDEVVDKFPDAWRDHSIPEGIEPAKGSERLGEYDFGLVTMSSDQTTLAWAVIDGRTRVSGTLRWPTDYRGGPVDHALELLRTAEAGFVESCPREKPPTLASLGKSRPAVSPVDADASELKLLEGDLVTELHKYARTRCARKRRR